MFSVDLDHLNILIMLILAFFSFRSYNSDTLAIGYESEEQENEVLNQSDDKNSSSKVQNIEQSSTDLSKIENDQPIQIPEKSSQSQMEIQTANTSELQVEVIAVHDKNVESNTVQCSSEMIEDESVLINSSQALDKEEEQESTLMNRQESRLDQVECDEENEDSSNEVSNINTQSVYSQIDEDLCGMSRKQKRKLIQKTKRKMKKTLKRQQQTIEGQIEVVEIQ